MKSIVISLIAAILVSNVVRASDAVPVPMTSSLPVQSEADLREYALDKVVRGFRDVTSETMVSVKNQPSWVDKRGTSAEDVLDKLFDTEFVYSLANDNDIVQGRVWLYDNENNLLFFGESRYTAKDLEKKYPSYALYLQRIPLLANVQSAEILAINEDGVTANHRKVDVSNGHILFDSWLAGVPNGILSVRFQDGSLMTYDLWSPVAESPVIQAESSATWQIEGHHVFRLTEKDVLNINFVEVWKDPTVIFEVRDNNQTVNLDVFGVVNVNGVSGMERPNSLIFTQVIGGSSKGVGPVFQDGPTKFTLPTGGTYRMKFDWNNFGKPGKLYTGPTSPVIEKGSL